MRLASLTWASEVAYSWVPLFGLTPWGKELLVERAKQVEQPLLINTMPLPVLPEEKQPRPLV